MNLYQILGIKKKATKKQIRDAYYKLAKEHHPDKNPGVSPQKFAEITTAYKILSDPAKRKLYDKTGQIQDIGKENQVIVRVAEAFHKVMNNPHIDVTKMDIFAEMKKDINAAKIQMNQELIAVENSIKRFTEVTKRVSGKNIIIKNMAEDNLDRLDKVKRDLNMKVMMCDETIEYMKNYKYKVDSNNPVKIALNFGAATDTA